MILPFLSAILGILAFLPFNFWPLGFFFLAPLFIFFIKEEKFWRLILGAFIFRLIFGLGTVYFTLEPITWLTSALIFLGLPMAVYFIKKFVSRYQLPIPHYLLLAWLPFLWTFFDYLEARYSFLPTSIVTAGNIFGSSPFLGLANFGGLIFLTFWTALINVLIVVIIFKTFSNFSQVKLKRFQLTNIDTVLAMLTVFIIFLSAALSKIQLQKNNNFYYHLKNFLNIAVVSTNENFNWDSFEEIKSQLTNRKIDLLIFPEDIFNNSQNSTATADFNIAVYQNLAKESKTNLAAGFDTFQTEKNGFPKRYDSVVLFNENGEIADIYHKNHLTFIGEYWPFGAWRPFYLNWLKNSSPEIKNYTVFNFQNRYSRGQKKLLTLKLFNAKAVSFASPICLEIHYPDDLKNYKERGAQFIVNPSSNRWLDLGIRHFLYLTDNLRKIESVWLKMPIISSGVKDKAGVIAPDGKADLINYESRGKNFNIYFGEIRF